MTVSSVEASLTVRAVIRAAIRAATRAAADKTPGRPDSAVCGMFSVRGMLTALAAATLLTLVTVSAATAQSGAPLRLAPPERLAAPSDKSSNPAGGVKPAGEGIVVQRLGGVDSEAVGVLQPGQGGLAATVWQGGARALAVDLLPRVPGTIASPPLRNLVRRLLLTRAPPPPAPADGSVDNSLVAARARLLVSMGAVDDAFALIAAAGRRTRTGDLAWPSFEARLLSGDIAGACRIVREYGGDLAGTDWQKALIFCQLIAEQGDQAQFGLNLLRERRIAGDPLFFGLAEALATRQTPNADEFVAPGAATPLNLALLRLGWTAIPQRMLDDAPAGVIAAMARMPDLPEAQRLAAAIRAEAAGSLPATDLRALFESLAVTKQELAAALTIADSEPPARAIALLYLSARSQNVPAARAEVLQRLWEVASTHGLAGTAARVAAPLLGEVPLLPEFSWFAGAAARIALYTSDLPRAFGWYEVVASAASSDSLADEAATGLWPLIRLALGDVRRLPPTVPPTAPEDTAPPVAVVAGGTNTTRTDADAGAGTVAPQGEIAVPWERARLDRWLLDDVERHRGAAAARAGRLLSMLDAAGDPVPDTAWRAALPPAAATTPADVAAEAVFRLGLDRAAAAGRQGETLLFATAAMAGRDAGSLDAATLHAIVRALARTGFNEPARAFALNAALAAGL